MMGNQQYSFRQSQPMQPHAMQQNMSMPQSPAAQAGWTQGMNMVANALGGQNGQQMPQGGAPPGVMSPLQRMNPFGMGGIFGPSSQPTSSPVPAAMAAMANQPAYGTGNQY
jgi:hypothetical protein